MKDRDLYLKLIHAQSESEIDLILVDLTPDELRLVLRRFVMAFGHSE